MRERRRVESILSALELRGESAGVEQEESVESMSSLLTHLEDCDEEERAWDT
jgi:hypothetical protein